MWVVLPKSSSGKVMVARGSRLCLVVVVRSAIKDAVKERCPDTKGRWGRTPTRYGFTRAATVAQMCESHQRRLSKKDLTSAQPEGGCPGVLLTALHRLDYSHYDRTTAA